MAMLAMFITFVVGCGSGSTNTASTDQAKTVPTVELPKGGHVEAVKQLPKKPLRIAFLSFQNNPFWFPVKDGAIAAQKYLKNYNTTVDYIVMGDDLTADRVVAAMETSIAKKYDAIAVVPIFDGTEKIIDKAVDAGIPVFSFVAQGSKPSTKQIGFIGQDAYAAGQIAGQAIEKATKGSGKIGVITGTFGATQHEQRMNGALDYLKSKDPGITVVGKYENKDKAETAYSLTKDMLTSNPDIKVIYVTAGGPFGAAKAIKDMNLTGKVGVVCYDHTPENLQYVRSGEIVASVAQDPFGQGFDTCVYLYNYLVAGQKPEKSFIPVKCEVVTPENVKTMYPESK